MKKCLVVISLFLLSAVCAFGQSYNPKTAHITHFAGVPSGSCTITDLAFDDATNVEYYCPLTIWVQVSGSGGGGVTYPEAANQNANGADTILFKRFTDTSPTGYAWRLENNAASSTLASVDVSGNALFNTLTLTSQYSMTLGDGTANRGYLWAKSGGGASNTTAGYLEASSSPTDAYSSFLFPCLKAGAWCLTSSVPSADSSATLAVHGPVNAQTGTSYAILDTDEDGLTTLNNASAIAVTLACPGGTSFANGWKDDLQMTGAGTPTITVSGCTINGGTTLTVPTTGVHLISTGSNYLATFNGAGGGSGTVTSIATTAPLGGGTITTTGTLTCTTCVTSAAALTNNGIVGGAGSQATAIIAPATGYAGVAQSLSCVAGSPCTIGPEGVTVDTQSSATPSAGLTDRLNVLDTTNNTTSTATTLPTFNATGYDQGYSLALLNGGSVINTATPGGSGTFNGNATLKIPGTPSGGNPGMALIYPAASSGANAVGAIISPKDANGLIPLTAAVSGTLPVGNGGTGSASPGTNAAAAWTVSDTTFTNATTAISGNACSASAATVTMTGVTTSMTFAITPSVDINASTGWGSTGGLVIEAWPTSNTLNYKICNQTASSITPAAVTWNVSAR